MMGKKGEKQRCHQLARSKVLFKEKKRKKLPALGKKGIAKIRLNI